MENSEIQKFKETLPRVFDEATIKSAIEDLSTKQSVPKTLYKRLMKAPTRIQLHWNVKAVRALYTFKEDYTVLDLLSAWTSSKSYLTNFSALYFNGLVDQQPKEHFLSTEARTLTNAQNKELNIPVMRQSFMKGHKTHQNYCYFNGIKFHFLEKANLNRIGVHNIELPTGEHKINLNVTNIERTLIDSVVGPHHSGGMDTVRAAFSKAQINIQQMALIYGGMRFLYPYWQTIGFLLELTKGSEISNQWAAMFGSPKIEFYYDRNYRTDWKLSQKWKVYTPPGVADGR